MELTLKREAILQEIKICQTLIDEYEEKLAEIKRKFEYMTDRLAVLEALDEKLEGTPRILNVEDIKLMTSDRFALAPEIKKYQSSISNLQANLKALHEMLD